MTKRDRKGHGESKMSIFLGDVLNGYSLTTETCNMGFCDPILQDDLAKLARWWTECHTIEMTAELTCITTTT